MGVILLWKKTKTILVCQYFQISSTRNGATDSLFVLFVVNFHEALQLGRLHLSPGLIPEQYEPQGC